MSLLLSPIVETRSIPVSRIDCQSKDITMTSASPDIVIVGGGIGDGALATVSLEPKLLLCLLTTCSSARAAMAI
jgi:hypothetical protein